MVGLLNARGTYLNKDFMTISLSVINSTMALVLAFDHAISGDFWSTFLCVIISFALLINALFLVAGDGRKPSVN